MQRTKFWCGWFCSHVSMLFVFFVVVAAVWELCKR